MSQVCTALSLEAVVAKKNSFHLLFNLNSADTWLLFNEGCLALVSGVAREAEPEAPEEPEPERELVPVLPGERRHPALHHRPGQRAAALPLPGESSH